MARRTSNFLPLTVVGCCVLAGCPPATGEIVEPPVNVATCEDHSDCDPFACIDAGCVAVECAGPVLDGGEVPAVLQCEAPRICGPANACILPDDRSCEESGDCLDGEVCHRDRCLDAAAFDQCISNASCLCGFRCVPGLELCLPSEGGCEGCVDGGPSCCGSGELCHVESGLCESAPTSEALADGGCPGACTPVQICDRFGRCTQCETDDDCGFGLRCNFATGACVSSTPDCIPPG